MKHLANKKITKEVEFLGDKVEIRKLSIKEVMDLQNVIKKHEKSKDQMAVLRAILRIAVVGAEEMTDEEFNGFPPGDLAQLSEEILAYCGLGNKGEPEGN